MSQSNAFVNGEGWKGFMIPDYRLPNGKLKTEIPFEGFDFLDDSRFIPTTQELDDYTKIRANKTHDYYEGHFNEKKNIIYRENSEFINSIFFRNRFQIPTVETLGNSSSIFRGQYLINTPYLIESMDDVPNNHAIWNRPFKKINTLLSSSFEDLYKLWSFNNYDETMAVYRKDVLKSWDTPVAKAVVNTINVHDSYIYPDGSKIVVGSGILESYKNNMIVKYNANGSICTTFNINLFVNATGQISGIEPVEGGKFLLFGAMDFIINNNGDRLRHYVIRINSDGTLDESFNSITHETFQTLSLDPANGFDLSHVDTSNDYGWFKAIEMIKQGSKYLLAFNQTLSYTIFKNIIRIDSEGLIDGTFDSSRVLNPISATGVINKFKMSVMPDGKIVLTNGDETFMLIEGTNQSVYYVVLDQDGGLDSGFTPLVISLNENIQFLFTSLTHLVIGSDIYIFGKDNASEYPNRITVKKFNASGTMDSSFVFSTIIEGDVRHAIKLDNGKIVITGDGLTSSYTHLYGEDQSINLYHNGMVILKSNFAYDDDITQFNLGYTYLNEDMFKSCRYLKANGNKFNFSGMVLDWVNHSDFFSIDQNEDGNRKFHYEVDMENFVTDGEYGTNVIYQEYDGFGNSYNKLQELDSRKSSHDGLFDSYATGITLSESDLNVIDVYKEALRELYTNPDFYPNSWSSEKTKHIFEDYGRLQSPEDIIGDISNLKILEKSFNRVDRMEPGNIGEVRLTNNGYLEAWDDYKKEWNTGSVLNSIEDPIMYSLGIGSTKADYLGALSHNIKPFTWSAYHIIKHAVSKIN